MKSNCLPAIIVAAALFAAQPLFAQTNYKFTNVADTNGEFSGFEVNSFSLNSSGTVAFSAALKAGGRGIYKWTGGGLQKIARTGETIDTAPIQDLSRSAFVDLLGNVAFNAILGPTTEVIYKSNGGGTPEIVSGYFYSSNSAPAISASGKVAWTAFNGFTNSNGVNTSRFYVLRNPESSEGQNKYGAIIAHSGGDGEQNLNGYFKEFVAANVSDSGRVIFRGLIRAGGEGIFLGKDPLSDRSIAGNKNTTTIADSVSPGSNFAIFGSRPDINNNDVIVFGAQTKTGGRVICRSFGGSAPAVYLDDTGAYSFLGVDPAINDGGTISFLGQVRSTGAGGIFTGPNPSLDAVIQTGQSLFGSTVVELGAGPRTLSNSGQVVFFYRLADGRRGLALADPSGNKTPTGDLAIKQESEPDSAFSARGVFLSGPAGSQLKEVSFEPEIGASAVFNVELTNTATEAKQYALFGSETGDTGWKVQAFFGTTDYWAQMKSPGILTPTLQPGEKLFLRVVVTGEDATKPLPLNTKHAFFLTVTASNDTKFTHDAVGAEVKTTKSVTVNSTGEEPAVDPSVGPDSNADKPGDQITLRSAIEYANKEVGADTIKFKIAADDPGMSGGVATIKPKQPLPQVIDTLTIDGSTQNPASATPPIQLDGVDLPFTGTSVIQAKSHDDFDSHTIQYADRTLSGLQIVADGCRLRGLSITRFPSFGIDVGGSNTFVQGCHIGVDASGRVGSANGLGGALERFGFTTWASAPFGAGVILRSSFNQIGGTVPRDRNLISGTSGARKYARNQERNPSDTAPYGLIIAGAASNGNIVVGNYFGLDSSGEAIPQVGEESVAGSFAFCDVLIFHGSGNQIGGTAPGSGNFFAHRGTGVKVSGAVAIGNIIHGNRFGTSVSGAKNLGKTTAVVLVAAHDTQITDNRISAGDGDGTDVNLANGILLASSASGNMVTTNQVTSTDTGIELTRDFYSTDPSPDVEPSKNTIEGNEVSFSRRNAVLIAFGHDILIKGNSFHDSRFAAVQLGEFGEGEPYVSGIRISENRIYGSGGLGISLTDPTLKGMRNQKVPTPNDFGDHDGGPNYRQNYPFLGSAVTSGGGVQIEGTLDTNVGERPYTIEFFANDISSPTGYGEGERFLGSLTTTTSFAGRAAFSFGTNVPVEPGEYITATATDPDGNTSEFSSVRLVRTGNDPDGDGVDNELEDRVPNRSGGSAPDAARSNKSGLTRSLASGAATAGFGDGNGDGVLDSQQANVASFRTILGNWVTLVSPSGTMLENIESSGPPEFSNLPTGVNFPVGFLNFGVNGVAPGGPAAVHCIFHNGISLSTAFGYGPLPGGGGQPGWYRFNHDGQTGAVLGGGELILNFVDGGRGDHDLQSNGRITALVGPASSGELLNIATRLRVQSGENVLIGGFIITGTEPKKVLIRGIGPSLAQFFSGTLADPTLQLFQGNTQLASNNDWKESEAEVAATGIAPSHDKESAIVYTLSPGFYTAVLQGNGGSTGIGVVEVYDLDQSSNSKLANIASRGFVDTGDNIMIGGLIIGPAGGSMAKVVVRAIGPSLGNFGIAGALQDPTLELVNSNGVILRANDSWQDSQQAEIEATGLQPADLREAALVETVAAGNYTAVVRGKDNTTGVGLVEVYHLD